MYCSKCGLEVQDSAAFCSSCGSKIESQQNLQHQEGSLSDSKAITPALKPGNVIEFGRYPHIAIETDATPISWIILDINTNTMEAVLISKTILDCKKYNGIKRAVTWKDSEIRNWLNTYFFNRAFNLEEKQKILKTQCTGNGVDSKNDLPQTEDYVFLLNTQEAKKMGGDIMRQTENTDYSKEKKTDRCCLYTYGWDNRARWWLRNRGVGGNVCVAYVHNNGSVYTHGDDVNNEHYGVRPAIRIQL